MISSTRRISNSRSVEGRSSMVFVKDYSLDRRLWILGTIPVQGVVSKK